MRKKENARYKKVTTTTLYRYDNQGANYRKTKSGAGMTAVKES